MWCVFVFVCGCVGSLGGGEVRQNTNPVSKLLPPFPLRRLLPPACNDSPTAAQYQWHEQLFDWQSVLFQGVCVATSTQQNRE